MHDHVPYDQAPHWLAHDAYFRERGVGAWLGGDIPFLSTNNYPFARQQAALIVAHVAALVDEGLLGAGERVDVLEIGAGLGKFAANFMRALDEGLGDAGRATAALLRYVFSDYAERTVREASAGPELAPLVAAGRVVPALFDARSAAAPRFLDGSAPGRIAAVLANYVCCVLPTKNVRKRNGLWGQLYAGADELRWRDVDPALLFPDGRNRALAEALVAGLAQASFTFPLAFLEFLRRAPALLMPGGLVVVNDYGSVHPGQLARPDDGTPKVYGETLNHDVAFSVFEPFATAEGMGLARTRDATRALHAAVLRPGRALAAPVASAFDALFEREHAGQRFLDVVAAGRGFLEQQDFARAARFFEWAIELDPRAAEMFLRLGTARLLGGDAARAVVALQEGRALDVWKRWEFAFELGRASTALGRFADAITYFHEALARREDVVTLINLGIAHQEAGHLGAALRAYRRAAALSGADDRRAEERIAAVRESEWGKMTALWDTDATSV